MFRLFSLSRLLSLDDESGDYRAYTDNSDYRAKGYRERDLVVILLFGNGEHYRYGVSAGAGLGSVYLGEGVECLVCLSSALALVPMLYGIEYVRRAVGMSGKLAVRRSAGGADSGLGAGSRSARVRAYGPLRKADVTGVVAIVLVGVGDGASLAADVAGSIAGVLVFVRSGYGSFVLTVVTYAVAISVVNVVGIVAVLVFTDSADRKLGAGSISAVASLKVYLFAASVNGAGLPMAGSVAYPDSVGTVSAGGNVAVGVAALGADSGISAVSLFAALLKWFALPAHSLRASARLPSTDATPSAALT